MKKRLLISRRLRISSFFVALTLTGYCLPASFLAVAQAKSTVTKNTKDPSDKNFKLGKQLFEQGDYDGAIDALLQSTYFARNGYAPQSFYYLGLSYKAKGQYQKALDALKHNVEQSMDKAGPGHLALAQVLTKMKNYDESRRECMRAMSATDYRDPLYRLIYLAEGTNEDEAGNHRSAIAGYKNCLGDSERTWDNYEAWVRMSECFMKLKEWVHAYTNLTKMLNTRNPLVGIQYDRVYLDLGICNLAKGNHQGAIEAWHKGLEYNFDNKECHLQLAMLFEQEKHLSSALKEYKQFVASSNSGTNKPEEDRPRIAQVEQRIASIEQRLSQENQAPAPTNPSPYMREQEQKNVEARMREEQERERAKMPTGDAGF